MVVAAIAGLILASVLGSMFYVCRIRGRARYDGLRDYVRKGWPIFSPLNCLLYLLTRSRARRPIIDLAHFPELDVIRDGWTTIREEGLALYRQQIFEVINKPDSSAYYDVGFRTFYKYGWSKFYLKWYGTTHRSAQALCPRTLDILGRVPSVNGAMFSVLPAGSKLTRHADPVACSLRYHLGLATPNSDACYINVDGTDHSWRDGEALLFDETYLHYAHNDAGQFRLILMCDVERPTRSVGRIVNAVYKALMRLTVVPNTEDDPRGLANRVFVCLAPVLATTRVLKQTNPKRYLAIKYSVNATLAAATFGLVVGTVYVVYVVSAAIL